MINPDSRSVYAGPVGTIKDKAPDMLRVPDEVLKDPRTRYSFANGQPMRRVTRGYVRDGIQVWPGVFSTSREFTQWKVLFTKECNKSFPIDVDDQGFSRTGVTGDFNALLSVPGVKMSQSNAPFVNREKVFEDNGIATSFKTERHKRIFEAVHDCMFEKRIEETPYHFSKVSSTSQPFFDYAPAIKQGMVETLLNNIEEVLECIDNDDLNRLRTRFGIIMCSTLVERHQPEGGKWVEPNRIEGKERWVNTPEHGLSGGRRGRRVLASKTNITKDLLGLENALAMRVRTAYGLCAAVSYLVSCFLVGYRAHYFEEYGFTWHHTTRQQIGEKIAGGVDVVGVDVTTMDQFMPKFLLDLHAEKLKRIWDPRLVKLISWINGCPYFAPQLGAGMDPFFAGDPRKVETFNVDVGLSSGRPDNPDLGKWYMTATYFCLMDDYFGDLLEQSTDGDRASIGEVLKGHHPAFALLDMGDDALIVFRDGYQEVATRLRAALRDAGKTKRAGLSPYAVLDMEHGAAFVGVVVVKDAVGELKTPIPNPRTFAINRHCPEHAWGSAHREFAAYGYLAALEHYSNAGSIITDIVKLQDDTWRHVMPDVPVPRALVEKEIRNKSLPRTASLSHADLEVILDPSKRYYKYTMEELSPEVRALFSGTIDGAYIESKIRSYIT